MNKSTWLPHLGTLCIMLFSTNILCADSAFGHHYEDGQLCIILNPGYTIEEVNARWETTTKIAAPGDNLYLVESDEEDLLELAANMNNDEAIELAEVNWLQETPEGTRQVVIAAIGGSWVDFVDQTMTERIGLAIAHGTSRGAGIKVAVLDTGVDPDHEVFEGRLSYDGFDCIDQDDEPWETANDDDEDNDHMVDEGYGHGTMVAGLIALIAPEAEILPIRVLNDDACGTIFGVAQGIMVAIARGADIINASFGAPVPSATIANRLRVAEAHNIITIAGAGNRDMETPPYYPAIDQCALMVTALDTCDIKADFADYHTSVIVAAPGVGIRSAYPGDTWGLGSGCSFATPLVAGEAALIMSASPGLSVAELELNIRAGIDPIYQLPGNAPFEGKLGSGRIYLPLALAGASATPIADGPAFSWLRVGPNPFRGEVRLSLAQTEARAIEIIDATGRLVRVLELNGSASTTWRGTDTQGRSLPAGAYFARLPGDDQERPVRLVIVR